MMNKSLEKTIFLFFVHEVLSSHKLALTWDGQYIPGQLIARLDGSFTKESDHYEFASKSLTRLGQKYGLVRIDKIFQHPVHPRFDSIYRLTFEQAELNMKQVARAFENYRDCVFAEPNYMIFSHSAQGQGGLFTGEEGSHAA
ncbi:MAG: hypothetical protein HYY14_04585 [Candidatus Omnitrophica bacterium]|nr:hypothetical protein [Candidatus Omnitrophota bacterium]